MAEKLIGTREAAEVLGVNPATVLRMVEREQIAAEVKAPGATGAFMFTRREVSRAKRVRDHRLRKKAEAAAGYTPDEIRDGALA